MTRVPDRDDRKSSGGKIPFPVPVRLALAGAVGLLAVSGCGAPDVPSKWGGDPVADAGGTGQPSGPTPPPYHQVDDLAPPTSLSIAVSGSEVTLSWTPPVPAPGGYILLVGPAPDALEFSTSTVPAGSSLALSRFMSWPRGRPFFVALQSFRTADNGHSTASGAVQVTMPPLEPATVQVDCSVSHVNDAPYLAAASFQGAFEGGSCVRGAFRDLDMGTAYDRTYGASYALDGVGRILDLGVLQSQRSGDTMDGPYPAMWFLLSPASAVTAGSSWTAWVDGVGPGQAQIFGGIFQLHDDFGWGNPCLYGIATAGSLTVTSASGLDAPGQGAFRIQGSVTFSDPYAVAGVCDRTCCQ